jgi:hypothetical protein
MAARAEAWRHFGGLMIRVVALLAALLSLAAFWTLGRAPAAEPPAPPPAEGIHVKGRWIVEVTNPDGSLAQRHEFENALTPGGQSTLASMLGGTVAVDRWIVRIDDELPSDVCPAGLCVNAVKEPASAGQLRLIADFPPAAAARTTTRVRTFTPICDRVESADTTAANFTCPGLFLSDFSEASRSIPVTAGQALRVVVTYSFN